MSSSALKKHWTAVVHINSSDTYAYSAGVYYVVLLEGDVIVRTYVNGRKGPGPSASVFSMCFKMAARCIPSLYQ